MIFFIFTCLVTSILPGQDNEQFENIIHGPRIIPDIIQKKLNKIISKFTIKLVPKKYVNLIKQNPSEMNKNTQVSSIINPDYKNTDFVFYATFSILSLAIIFLFYILVRQISNRNNKNIQNN